MSKRKAENDLWELHKEELCQLYERDGKPLPAVREHMINHHGFDRTYVRMSLSKVAHKWALVNTYLGGRNMIVCSRNGTFGRKILRRASGNT